KTLADNYTVLGQMEKITNQLSYPLLLGTSRKSFITEVLDILAEQRGNASGAATCIGIQKGANIIRVHDVKRNREVASMTERILQVASTVGLIYHNSTFFIGVSWIVISSNTTGITVSR